ncbi:DEAD/DEAH box helicase [Thiohalophilus sp.]|uniref:DEAD/DEAH box helicase n=1 Tax=Thiohalophilus sp. TaxID=3028392 RepID=UPI0039753D97
MSFSNLGLNAELLSAIADQGYSAPTDIQTRAIPTILAGHDILAGAQTGTGKTAAFTLPLLQRLSAAKPASRHIRVLMVAPTRELAQQVADSVRTYGRHLPLRSAVVYGGMPIGKQIKQLKEGVDLLIATPGRLLDLVNRRSVDLSRVESVVLDEADRMLDMGFLPAIEQVFKLIPAERQTLLLSATFSDAIKKMSARFLNKPEYIQVAEANSASLNIDQSFYWVDSPRKRELLSHMIDGGDWQQLLVFTRTKRGADRLAKQLQADGVSATAIHGDKTQNARTRALRDFKHNKVTALIATDVAARGLDIDHLPLVINFDLPDNPEDYLHRIGRTGRGGKSGTAISLVGSDERGRVSSIQRLLKTKIPGKTMTGFEPAGGVREIRDETRPRGKPPVGAKRGGPAQPNRNKRRSSGRAQNRYT